MKKITCVFLICTLFALSFSSVCFAADLSAAANIGDVAMGGSEQTAGEISLSDAKNENVTVSGTYTKNALISIEIKNISSGIITLSEQGEADESGNYSISAKMSDDVTVGTYELKIGASELQTNVLKYFKVTEDKNEAEVALAAVNGTIEASVNGGAAQNLGSSNKSLYPVGTKISLTAVSNNENAAFLYWKDDVSKAVVSANKTFEIIVGTSRTYTAVFADAASGAYITFRANGRILAGGYNSVNVPSDPYVAGYTFDGWYIGTEKVSLSVGQEISAQTDTEYKALFALDETEYTVTASNADSEGGSYKYNEKVTLKAADKSSEGLVFAYWQRDGKVACYSETYSFYVNADTSVSAVYTAEAVAKQAVVVMAEPIKMESTNRIAFYAERDIPEEYKVIESGILLNRSAGFDLDGAQIQAVSKSTANKGQYTIRKANVNAGDTWYGKAYVMYTDGTNVYTAYSDEVSMTF